MSNKVLVTGCQGYIGSRLCEYLSERGITCIGLDTGFFRNEVLCEVTPFPVLSKDVRDLNENDLDGVGCVIHLAAISNDPLNKMSAEKIYDPTRQYTERLARICKKLGIRFIFPSSCSVYGVGSNEFLNEQSPTDPQTGYSLNKLQIEEDLQQLSDSSFSPIALRMATVFGASPRVRFDLVINMFVGMGLTSGQIILNSNGQAWRPHLYIEDACEAFYRAVQCQYSAGELLILNVGNNENNMKVLDLVDSIKKCSPSIQSSFLSQGSVDPNDLVVDRKIQDGVDKRTYKVNFDKIEQFFPGFKAKTSVDEGVRLLYQKLKELNLKESDFKRRGFYRLQHLEYLHASNLIDNNLCWV